MSIKPYKAKNILNTHQCLACVHILSVGQCGVRNGWCSIAQRKVLVGDGGRPGTSARVVLKVQTVLEEQTGFRFALGPALFSDGAHTEVFSVEVLEEPLMWSRVFRNQWR